MWLWAVAVGVAIGGALGTLVGRLMLYLRREHREGLGAEEFLALGLIALAYGAAVAVDAYGFLAVFAAGLAFRGVESRETGTESSVPSVPAMDAQAKEELETDPALAPRQLAHAVLTFNEQLDRLAEVVVVLLVGALLPTILLSSTAWGAVALLLALIRPVSVVLGLTGSHTTGTQRRLMAWFGIRGIGTIYYLTYAINHGLPAALAPTLTTVAFLAVAVSIVVHGVSATRSCISTAAGTRYPQVSGGRPGEPCPAPSGPVPADLAVGDTRSCSSTTEHAGDEGAGAGQGCRAEVRIRNHPAERAGESPGEPACRQKAEHGHVQG